VGVVVAIKSLKQKIPDNSSRTFRLEIILNLRAIFPLCSSNSAGEKYSLMPPLKISERYVVNTSSTLAAVNTMEISFSAARAESA